MPFSRFLPLLPWLCLLVTGPAAAQTIRGTIVDEANAPVPYATVYLPGQQTGLLTDDGGKFSLEAGDAGPADTLRVSCIGYETSNWTIGEITQMSTPRQLTLPAANYTLGVAEVVGQKIRMRRKKVGMPGLMNGTYGFTASNTPRPIEFGTILRPDAESRLEEVIINLRDMAADSFLLSVNIYDVTFDRVSSPLLKERVFVDVSRDDIKKDIVVDFREQGIQLDRDFMVTVTILKVVGTFGEVKLAAKTGKNRGFSRLPGTEWQPNYMAPNIQARVAYPKQ